MPKELTASLGSSQLDDVQVLAFYRTSDGLWWARIRHDNAEFDATLTVQAFKALFLRTDEPCQLFQFVTVAGALIRVVGLPSESDRLNKLLRVPEEKGA